MESDVVSMAVVWVYYNVRNMDPSKDLVILLVEWKHNGATRHGWGLSMGRARSREHELEGKGVERRGRSEEREPRWMSAAEGTEIKKT